MYLIPIYIFVFFILIGVFLIAKGFDKLDQKREKFRKKHP